MVDEHGNPYETQNPSDQSSFSATMNDQQQQYLAGEYTSTGQMEGSQGYPNANPSSEQDAQYGDQSGQPYGAAGGRQHPQSGVGSFNMAGMAGALPSGPSSFGGAGQFNPQASFSNQGPAAGMNHPQYGMNPAQFVQPYAMPGASRSMSAASMHAMPQQVLGAGYYSTTPPPYAYGSPQQAGMRGPGAAGATLGRGGSPFSMDSSGAATYYGDYAMLPEGGAGGGQHQAYHRHQCWSGNRRSAPGGGSSSSGTIPSTPRGPPRKPKQSGHALWVGNLPSGATVGDLKDHFSRDATRDIESVFLISKSNCAFVNYSSEPACAGAMARFHDSKFQGVRLVCRLRRGNVVGPPSHAGPASKQPFASPSSSSSTTPASSTLIGQQQDAAVTDQTQDTSTASNTKPEEQGQVARVPDKYFVMKSLTVEDMELSVRNNIWATQAHNENALNKAFDMADNVYLIFSANKSGEYFGFARMASPISEEAAADLDWTPRGNTAAAAASAAPATSTSSGGAVGQDRDVPRSIPTAPTQYAPKGRIIDDSARGTIFWEVDRDDEDDDNNNDNDNNNEGHDDNDKENHNADNTAKNQEGKKEKLDTATTAGTGTEEMAEPPSAAVGEQQAFGKPFKVTWLSTHRLPFYRTRGLRNPWNVNREVKIARDGTEIETSVGRRLLAMFGMPPTGPAAGLAGGDPFPPHPHPPPHHHHHHHHPASAASSSYSSFSPPHQHQYPPQQVYYDHHQQQQQQQY